MSETDQLAQAINLPGGTITGPLQGNPTTLADLFKLNGGNLLNIIIFLAGAVLLLYILYGGFKYLTAQGDPKAMDAARNTITYAVIGFGIVAFSYLIFQVVQLFFGINILGSGNNLIPSAYAQGVDIGDLRIGSRTIKQAFPSVSVLINRVLVFALGIAGLIFLVMVVMGGLRWVSSQGDKAAVTAARGTLTTAAIGLVIVAAGFIVLQVIQFVTGFQVTGGTIR